MAAQVQLGTPFVSIREKFNLFGAFRGYNSARFAFRFIGHFS